MSNNCIIERTIKLWHDGVCYEIGIDIDGLGLVEINQYEPNDKKPGCRMTMDRDCAREFIKILNEYVENDENFIN